MPWNRLATRSAVSFRQLLQPPSWRPEQHVPSAGERRDANPLGPVEAFQSQLIHAALFDFPLDGLRDEDFDEEGLKEGEPFEKA